MLWSWETSAWSCAETLGVNGTYLAVWKFGLAYTRFFGPEGTLLDGNNNFSYQQFLRDRAFIALSASRTF